MSIFEESQTEETADQTQSYVDQLVKAKGDNWNDPEVLAKGKLEADTYIQSLEEQLSELRSDLDKQDYSAQLLQELRGKATDSTVDPVLPTTNTAETQDTATPAGLSEEDLKSLVDKALSDKEKQTVTERNQKLVEEELTKQFGTEAQAEVNKRAKELGMSLERMQEIASESPSAFLSLMGQAKQNFDPMVNSSVRTESVNQTSSDRDWNYYQKLRKENRSLYYSPKVQQQMLNDKLRLGERFGN